MGSVVSHEFGPRNNIPQYVCIPGQPNEFAGTGYLSSSYAPFSLGSDPAADGFTVRDLQLPGGVTAERFARRRSVLETVNQRFVDAEKADALDAVDTFYERAYGMVMSPQAQEAFDLSKETDQLRDEYGRNQAGSRLLMARRLIEAGARFVTMTYGGWDMHDNIDGAMKGQVPPIDQAFAASFEIWTNADDSVIRWSASLPNLAALRKSTARRAAITGQRSSASCLPAAA